MSYRISWSRISYYRRQWTIQFTQKQVSASLPFSSEGSQQVSNFLSAKGFHSSCILSTGINGSWLVSAPSMSRECVLQEDLADSSLSKVKAAHQCNSIKIAASPEIESAATQRDKGYYTSSFIEARCSWMLQWCAMR
ncbi:hypothetical protein KSP40_PGU000378 [Platanthera guangdongensis]|uniref:Uncharacterized protein n=1 Tax=Platanthera guangdongensis TaxID=2320717 RepID=A0ABR2LQT0_9ASPA